jgi:carbonic anhydrase
MTETSLLQQIVGANKSFLSGIPKFLDAAGDPFVVVSCIDARLTGLLEPALGLPRHRAGIIRTAGNQLNERNRDTLRSIAAALFVKNAREILIVGHTDCGMCSFSVAEVTENFRKAGIARSAFGDEDLRTWFGAFAGVRENVLGSIAFLRKSGLVPGTVKIHGIILDTEKGALEIVLDGDLVREVAAPLPGPPEPTRAEAAPTPKTKEEAAGILAPEPPPAAAKPQPEALAKKGPIVVGASGAKAAPPPPPNSLLDAAMILRDAFHRERQNPQIQKTLASIKAKWNQDRNPYRIFEELQQIAHGYEARYPRVPGALAYLEQAVRSGHADKIGFGEIFKRIFD